MAEGYKGDSTLLGVEIMTAWAASTSDNDFMGERLEAIKQQHPDPVNDIVTALVNLSAHLLQLRHEEQGATFSETLQLIARHVARQNGTEQP